MTTRRKQLSKEQRAWAAGIVDGEASIMLYKQKSATCRIGYRYRVGVAMTSTDYKLCKLFKSWFGGTISNVRQDRFRDGINRKQAYRWGLNSIDESINFLSKVSPYLFLKDKQAALCTEFLEGGGYGYKNQYTLTQEELDRREAIFVKIKKLNRRGVPSETKR